LLLAIYPDAQEKLAEELSSIFKSVNEDVTDDHLNQMTYMDLVIKEAMRFWPILPFIGRSLTADVTLGEIANFHC
jgi:cytochrome P450 family 4